MNLPAPARRLLAEAVIAVSLCAGAHYFVVDPAQARLAEAKAKIAAHDAERALRSGVLSLTDAQVADLHRQTRERLDDIARRSHLAEDQTVLFERVSSIAGEHGLRLESLTPGASPTSRAAVAPAPPPPPPPPTGGAGPAEPPPPPPAKDTRVGYTVTVVGPYASVAGFVRALGDGLGYTLVRAVRITRAEGADADAIRAVVETDHLAFDASAVVLPNLPATTPAAAPTAAAPTRDARPE